MTHPSRCVKFTRRGQLVNKDRISEQFGAVQRYLCNLRYLCNRAILVQSEKNLQSHPCRRTMPLQGFETYMLIQGEPRQVTMCAIWCSYFKIHVQLCNIRGLEVKETYMLSEGESRRVARCAIIHSHLCREGSVHTVHKPGCRVNICQGVSTIVHNCIIVEGVYTMYIKRPGQHLFVNNCAHTNSAKTLFSFSQSSFIPPIWLILRGFDICLSFFYLTSAPSHQPTKAW